MNMDRERDIIIGKEVREGGKIDQHCQVNLRSRTGHLEITQKVDGNSIASLFAPNGSITIDEKIGGNAQVTWQAADLICPSISDGEVNRY